MKTSVISAVHTGATLELKPARAEAYGMESPTVTFQRLQERKGYSVPWVVAIDARGAFGHYRPSDFQ